MEIMNSVKQGIIGAVILSVIGCAPFQNTPNDPNREERLISLGRAGTAVACELVSRSLKASERDPLKTSLLTVIATSDNQFGNVSEALDSVEKLRPSHKLLIGTALEEGWNLIPEDIRTHRAHDIVLLMLDACVIGVDSGAPIAND